MKRTGYAVMAAILACAFTAQADSNVGFNEAPKQNKLQKIYFDWVNQAGGLRCEPKGAMKTLTSEPNKCYLDLDKCPVSINALKGKLSKEHLALLADLVKTTGDAEKPPFTAACPGSNGPQFTHILGFQGVGYAGLTKSRPDLLKLVAKSRLKKAGQNVRNGVTEALWLLGKDDASIAALKDLVEFDTRNRAYKHLALQTLATWKSDAAVPYCTNALTAEKDGQLVQSCIMYLGRRGAKGAYSKMIRIMEKHTDFVIPALGTLGEKKAVATLETFLEENDGNNRRRIPAIVSLINLGQTKHMTELSLYLAGKKPLSKRDKEKLAKKKAREAKRKRKKKKKKKKDPRIEFDLARQAAMESVRITNPKVQKALNKALWATTKIIDDKKREWETGVYATIALAQRGDAKAIKALPALLESPTEKIRKAVITAIGGRWHSPHSNWQNRGSGVVADKSLLPAIYNFYDNEPKQADKTLAIHAAATIRTVADLK